MITNFREIRGDGKVIDRSVTIDKMIDLGWMPDKVVRLEWMYDGSSVVIENKFGILSKVLYGENKVVMLLNRDDVHDKKDLVIVDGLGGNERKIPNKLDILGREVVGKFVWFEDAALNLSGCFSVVFEDPDKNLFEIAVNVITGCLVNIAKMER